MSSAQVMTNLESVIDSVSEEIIRNVWESPGYDEGYMDRGELSLYVAANVQSILHSLGSHVEPSNDAYRTAQEIGKSRALQGVPVEAVVNSWVSAERAILKKVLRLAEHVQGEDLRAIVQNLEKIVGRLTNSSVEAYRRTQDEVTYRYDHLEADLLAALAKEESPDPDEINRRAAAINIDATLPYVAIALAAGASMQATHSTDQLRVRRYLLGEVAPYVHGQMLTGTIEKGQIILVPVSHSEPEALITVLSRIVASKTRPGSMLVAVSEHCGPLTSARSAYFEAQDALIVAARLGWTDRVVKFRDVATEVMILRNPDVLAPLQATIEPLTARPELLETCWTYLECGLSSSETARRLYVHPNTIPYRLRLIENIIGSPLSDVTQMAGLIMALRAYQLREP